MSDKDWIELVGVPVVLKAVDFLFGLAKQRFGKSGTTADTKTQEIETSSSGSESPPDDLKLDTARQSLLHQRIGAAVLSRHEDELAALLDQLQIHQRNLNLAEQQRAKWGESLVPAVVNNNIQDERRAIVTKVHRLERLLVALIDKELPKELMITERLNDMPK